MSWPKALTTALHFGHVNASALVVLDVLLTGLIGVIVDAATGAWYELKPETVTVVMEKIVAEVEGPDRIEITVRAKPEKDQTAVSIESSSPVQVHVEKSE